MASTVTAVAGFVLVPLPCGPLRPAQPLLCSCPAGPGLLAPRLWGQHAPACALPGSPTPGACLSEVPGCGHLGLGDGSLTLAVSRLGRVRQAPDVQSGTKLLPWASVRHLS